MWLRRAVQRPYGPRRAPRLGGRALGFALATFLLSVAPSQLHAQGQSGGTTRSAKTVLNTRVKANPNSKMLVRANELRYDYQREQISAVGNVQIYYDGAVLEADRVTHDRKANRLSARGNVRYQTKDGNIIRTDEIDLDADFRDGFINSLQVETADRTRFAAARAERSGGNLTVLESGSTRMRACKKDTDAAPLAVKAARIIPTKRRSSSTKTRHSILRVRSRTSITLASDSVKRRRDFWAGLCSNSRIARVNIPLLGHWPRTTTSGRSAPLTRQIGRL